MYNCEHEIKCPENKYIKYYLWYDYFHDSKIESIEFSNSKRKDAYSPDQIVLTIKSWRDSQYYWDNKLKGTDAEKEVQLNEIKQKYTYVLTFADCKYFNCEKSMVSNDYITGRFKNSNLLQKVIKSTSKPYYHFRIETDDGYLDIIFSKFKIKRQFGRIRIDDFEIEDYIIELLKRYGNEFGDVVTVLLNDKGELIIEKLIELACNGADAERYNALHYLLNYTNERLIDIARSIMKFNSEEYEMSRALAISILGIEGDEKDLQLLFDEYFAIEERYTKESICYCSTLLHKRHVMDAIEKIKYGNGTKYKLLL